MSAVGAFILTIKFGYLNPGFSINLNEKIEVKYLLTYPQFEIPERP